MGNIKVGKRLSQLRELQSVDTEMQYIERLKGTLPDELQRLEDSLASLKDQVSEVKSSIASQKSELLEYKTHLENIDALIFKYTDQRKGIRNNREYDAITKEMDLQRVEKQIVEKKIKANQAETKRLKVKLQETEALAKEQTTAIGEKTDELDKVSAENEVQGKELAEQRVKLVENLDAEMHTMYQRIRNHFPNKLAVVDVKRGACGGCFNVVPPQMQVEIRLESRVVTCEHCGRILSTIEEKEELTQNNDEVAAS